MASKVLKTLIGASLILSPTSVFAQGQPRAAEMRGERMNDRDRVTERVVGASFAIIAVVVAIFYSAKKRKTVAAPKPPVSP
jgi:hypothetical protein